ncbi:hypothetical protein LJB77_00660 [Ruminococcaceae bacterium OttesenSCG-928-N02]|nr:hypothetical protein [Ruminococcaceae bacterium OttesenSCG-928-N02]
MDKLRVLFLGNSHTFFNDMPAIFKKMAQAGQNVEVEVTMQAHPGVTWAWHLNQNYELRYALVHGKYDYLVMQQAAHSPSPAPEDTMRDGKAIIEKARLCGTTPIVLLPWAERHDPAHQAIMYNTYTALAKEAQVTLSPVGRVYERTNALRKDIDLFWFDGEHCSPYGSYVSAICAYAIIFNESPVGLPALSIKHNLGDADDFAVLAPIMKAYMEDRSNTALLAEYREVSASRFANIWDAEKTWIALDEEKARTLQEWVWEFVQGENA